MKTHALYLFLLLALPSAAFAHEESKHAGKPVEGTVTELSQDTLKLATGAGPASVTLTPETKVERGEKDVGRAALVSGARVAVFGTKVPGQGVVAKEIVLDAESGYAEGHTGH
jgi:hypothetical protein